MQSILSRNISDIQLLEELRKIFNCEMEHEVKTGSVGVGNTEKVGVNSIETEEVNSDPQIAKLLTELKNVKLQVNHISGSGNRRNQTEEVSEVGQILLELKNIKKQMDKLSTGKDEQIAWLTGEMESVREGLKKLERSVENKSTSRSSRKVIKCVDCEREGKFCKHCAECGGLGHKRAECPTKIS